MNLTTEQAHISAYIFHPFNNPEEPLFKVGDFEGLRKEFQSMCPSVTVHDRIVHMMAMKITWNQKRVSSPTKWTLPPAFVRAVKMGLSIEDLVSEFADYWMPPFENLSHICVPIETSCGLWYLMVASIADKQLFHIAPYFEKQDVYPRQQTIEKMWQTIAQMSKSPHFPAKFLAENFNDDMWTVSDPIGHLGIGFCQHTAVYVLDWMDSENPLHNNGSFGHTEEVIRMRLAMNLLLGEHNSLKDKLEYDSTIAWMTKRYA
ncbi:hypothetical protein P8452_74708 [Trifolium repens]|nr:hypothetical protein P8452_74708 [Trifolium repens]